jgi:hypothetical protein
MTPEFGYHPMSAVRKCMLNIVTFPFRIWRPSPLSKISTSPGSGDQGHFQPIVQHIIYYPKAAFILFSSSLCHDKFHRFACVSSKTKNQASSTRRNCGGTGLKEGETDIYRANLMRKIGRGRELKRNKNTQVFFLSPNRKPNEDFRPQPLH